ncbi:MAG: YqaA family protein [Amaricoccus sp.]
MLRRLYDWTISFAASPHAIWVLAAVSFVESSFFPIPPDVLLIPMIIARPERAWLLAGVCTAASVVGGFLGYAIGYYAWDAIGEPVLRFYGVMDRYDALRALYEQWGAWIIVIKGATPIPFKLVTIASGAFHFDLWTFALASLVSRSIRFFLIAALLWYFGAPIRDFIERRLGFVFSLAVAAVVGGFLLIGLAR